MWSRFQMESMKKVLSGPDSVNRQLLIFFFSFSCRRFLIVFCSTTPLCGSFQVFRYPEVQEAILDVIDGITNIRASKSRSHFQLIKRHAPIMADLLLTNTINGSLDANVANIARYILVHVNKTLVRHSIPQADQYGNPSESPYDYFPGFPVVLGNAVYAMDKNKSIDDIYCRKMSGSHPFLSPGIFTLFCRHRVCLGFSLMSSSESPRTAFNIFLQRFTNYLPQLRIFYDNCCNLHQFCLNREPARFSETIFLIDRLHYQDHTSCTEGYSTNSYNSDPHIKSINTQINEQANADLRRLTKQIAYMKPENVMVHVKLFLAERNQKKRSLVN